MTTVKELLAQKGTHVMSIGAAATVLDAAVLMNDHKIGCLVVTEGRGQVEGIITERDVLRKVVAECRDPGSTKVAEVMTTKVFCSRLDTPMEEARSVFKNRRIRHLPVVDEEGMLRGLISIGDLNAYQADAQELTITYLHEYIYGRV
ncbi:MAG: CBS domain-containing protein [Phycisphaeraceae bacterium]